MALAENIFRAVIAGAKSILEGVRLTLSSIRFWTTHGIQGTAQRRDVINRATALASGSTQAELGDPSQTLADAFAPTGYGVLGGQGGPAETPWATVYARVSYEKNGVTLWATYSQTFPWATNLQDIHDAISVFLGDIESRYQSRNAVVSPGSMIIY